MRIDKLRRPGVEIDIKSAPKKATKARGTVVLTYPLAKCPRQGFVRITRDTTLETVLGEEDARLKMMLERALTYCKEVLIYQVAEAKEASADISAESVSIKLKYKYSGTEGNKVVVSVKQNQSKFDVRVKLGNRTLEEVTSASTWGEVVDSLKTVEVILDEAPGSTALTVKDYPLSEGTSPNVTIGSYATFLEQLRPQRFNVLVTPFSVTGNIREVEEMSAMFVRDIRDKDDVLDVYVVTTENNQKDATSNDEFKYVIKQTGLQYSTDEVYRDWEVKLIFGAMVAGAEPNESFTNYEVEAVSVVNPMYSEAIEDALRYGYIVFYTDMAGKVRVVKDQTNFVSMEDGDTRPNNFTDGMVLRICDHILMYLKEHFSTEWIGKQPCTEDSAKLYRDVVYSILTDYQKNGYLQNVQSDDVEVTLADNVRKMFVLNLALQPIEVTEKLYLSAEVR